MTKQEVKALLPTLAEPAYQAFYQKLIPDVQGVLGVRMPHLRRIARAIVRQGDWQAYLRDAEAESYEEILLQGLVIGYAPEDWETLLPYVQAHVRKIDNWSTCDVFCGGLKIAKKRPEAVWAFVLSCFDRPEPYAIRFAAVMSLWHFLDDDHIDEVLARLDGVREDDYYVKMAVAWAVSMAFVAQREKTMRYLQSNRLDDWTYNKALQKIIESQQVDDATRNLMRSMKRKKGGPHAKT